MKVSRVSTYSITDLNEDQFRLLNTLLKIHIETGYKEHRIFACGTSYDMAQAMLNTIFKDFK